MCAGAVLRSRRVCFVSVERKFMATDKEKGMANIKSALSDTEETLKEAANATGERAQELCEKAFAQLKLAKDRAAEVQGTIVERGKQMTYATDGYVHRHPWQSAGIAVCIGVLLGLLINRK